MKPKTSTLLLALLLPLTAIPVAVRGQTSVTYAVLHDFTGGDGVGLTLGADGNFYGTTVVNINSGGGSFYQVTPAGVFTTLYTFPDTQIPGAKLILGTDGNFYGTTGPLGTTSPGAGDFNAGTVFVITPAGVLTTLYAFPSDDSEGSSPTGLVRVANGDLYGITGGGGSSNDGTVFRVSAGALTTLHSFTGSGTDGSGPEGLTLGSDGNFYGTTQMGGSSGNGTVFQLTSGGTFNTLHSFAGVGTEGANPMAGVVEGSDHNFYGTTLYGGNSNDGTVFQVTPASVLTTLYDFTGTGTDGANPLAGLVPGQDGNLYGTTFQGGSNNDGTVFQITLTGAMTSLFSFAVGDVASDGFAPNSLAEGTEGNFYGTTAFGSNASGQGSTIFALSLNPATTPSVTLAATIPSVTAGSGEFAEFTLSLSAPATVDTVVSFTIKGTGVNGTDYVLIKDQKKIKAGKTSKPIKIVPQGNLGGASKKTVVLTLQPGSGYTVGTTGKVKVKIIAP